MKANNSSSRGFPPRNVMCVGAVVTKDDQMLLVRQAKGHSLEGKWSIPWGFVDTDEYPDAAACRETLEESNIEADIQGLLGIQELHNPGWTALVFLCEHKRGTPSTESKGETDQARYFTLEDLTNFDEPIEPWCKWIVLKVLHGNHVVIPLEMDNPYNPLKSYL